MSTLKEQIQDTNKRVDQLTGLMEKMLIAFKTKEEISGGSEVMPKAKKAAKPKAAKKEEIFDLNSITLTLHPYESKTGSKGSFVVIGDSKAVKAILKDCNARYVWPLKSWVIGAKSKDSLIAVLKEQVPNFKVSRTVKTYDELKKQA